LNTNSDLIIPADKNDDSTAKPLLSSMKSKVSLDINNKEKPKKIILGLKPIKKIGF